MWNILCMVPLNIVGPFLYILDVLKDSLQVALLLVSIGGITTFSQHLTTFSSVVSTYFNFRITLRISKILFQHKRPSVQRLAAGESLTKIHSGLPHDPWDPGGTRAGPGGVNPKFQ